MSLWRDRFDRLDCADLLDCLCALAGVGAGVDAIEQFAATLLQSIMTFVAA